MKQPKRLSVPKKLDLVIDAGTLLTMDPRRNEVDARTLISIQGGKIAGLDRWTKSHAQMLRRRSRQWLDASEDLVMPGLVNGHMHLPMSLLRGLAEDKPFDVWLHKTILPIESKLVSPDFVKSGTELAALECIQTGTTTVCDMYYFDDAIADTLDRAGLRGLVAPAVAQFPTPDDPQQVGLAFKRAESLSRRFAKHPRMRVALGPHAPYTVGDELFRACAQKAQQLGIGLHVHVSETQSENETSQREHGCSPVERLHRLGVTGPRTMFAHGVWLSDADIRILSETGTSVIHNPESNMKLSCGTAPIGKLLKAGVRVGLGTDGAASNNNLNLFEEMGSAARLQRLAPTPDAVTARDILNMATLGGAHALGLGDVTGSLEVGKSADLIVLDIDQPHLYPRHDWVSHLVYSASGHEVKTTICEGQFLMRDRSFKTLRPQTIYKKSEAYRKKIEKVLRA